MRDNHQRPGDDSARPFADQTEQSEARQPKHTPGPLFFRERKGGRAVRIKRRHWEIGVPDAEGLAIVFRSRDYAARFVACWNACEGLNPAAIPELLAAVEWCSRTASQAYSAEGPQFIIDKIESRLRAALEKAKS